MDGILRKVFEDFCRDRIEKMGTARIDIKDDHPVFPRFRQERRRLPNCWRHFHLRTVGIASSLAGLSTVTRRIAGALLTTFNAMSLVVILNEAIVFVLESRWEIFYRTTQQHRLQ